MFGSALLRCEGVRGFGFGIGCLGVIQMTQDGRRQVGIGRIGVGMVTVVTGDVGVLRADADEGKEKERPVGQEWWMRARESVRICCGCIQTHMSGEKKEEKQTY